MMSKHTNILKDNTNTNVGGFYQTCQSYGQTYGQTYAHTFGQPYTPNSSVHVHKSSLKSSKNIITSVFPFMP